MKSVVKVPTVLLAAAAESVIGLRGNARSVARMLKVNLADLPWGDWQSPTGKFFGSGQQVSAALGAKHNANLRDGGHPFDLEHGRLRPGKSGCPYHSHSSQWELFVITAGRGTVRTGAEQREVKAGDAIMHPPGDTHQLTNTGDVDLHYLLFCDNPVVDVWRYPDSNKWGYKPAGAIFRPTFVDYWVDEDVPEEATPRSAPPPPSEARATFVTIADIPEQGGPSPKGRYCSYARDISLALGGVRDTGMWGGGHPFDLQHRRVPPGAAVCPLHVHSAQWELFVALSGEATVQHNDERHIVRAGDVFLQPPGIAHQITNTGAMDFGFYVLADNHQADSTYYPNSQKWNLKPQRKIFRMVETGYYDGEE